MFKAWPDSQISFGGRAIGHSVCVCACTWNLKQRWSQKAWSIAASNCESSSLYYFTVSVNLDDYVINLLFSYETAVSVWVLRVASLVHNKVSAFIQCVFKSPEMDMAKEASHDITSPVIHFRWTVPKRKDNLLHRIWLHFWELSNVFLSCVYYIKTYIIIRPHHVNPVRHAGAIRHDVADHAAVAATVRDAVDKVASGVTRPHMYWWSCLQHAGAWYLYYILMHSWKKRARPTTSRATITITIMIIMI